MFCVHVITQGFPSVHEANETSLHCVLSLSELVLRSPDVGKDQVPFGRVGVPMWVSETVELKYIALSEMFIFYIFYFLTFFYCMTMFICEAL